MDATRRGGGAPDPSSPRIGAGKGLLPWPSRLVVEVTTRCNLACPQCPKQCSEGSEVDGDLAPGVFEALRPALPRLESLVLNGIGEPLLHPGLEDLVAAARRDMPSAGLIGFQTNGVLLDPARARTLLEAGLDRVAVSLDAIEEGLFAELRRGGSLPAALAALDALVLARRETGRKDFRLGVEFVARRENLDELPDLVGRVADLGVDFMLVSQLFPYEAGATASAAYEVDLDLARGLRDKYAALAASRCLDLHSYSNVYLRYSKSPAELEIVRLAAELQEEAASLGVTVNLERLLRRDEGWTARALDVFALAAEVARESGLDLSLPEASPRAARSCEFVEGGTAFISREGGVHPCYFLWHRYACHLGGWEKRVGPKSFGTLPLRGIEEIWNDPAFARFRRNVLRYEYPFCLNCNLALCDYVQVEDFSQDCHINEEPCAACLWCMGLFKCLF